MGAVGRSINPLCVSCGSFHSSNSTCPDENIRHLYCKWRANSRFDKRNSLYNWWSVKKEVKKTGKIILCEGIGDCLRLEEAGIHISVGMFSASLTDEQQIILEKSGAYKVYLGLDNDEAGQDGIKRIAKQLDRSFNVEILKFPQEWHDIGEIPVEETKRLIGKVI